MRMQSVLKSTLFAAAATIIGTGAALANPIVDTIGLPGPGGVHIGLYDHETLVNPPAQTTLQGTGVIQTLDGDIQSYGNSANARNTGANGIFPATSKIMTDVFTGFNLRTSTYDAVKNQTTLFFTGGQLNIYVSKTSQAVPSTSTANIATNEFNAGLGNANYSLWLALKPIVMDINGDTFTASFSGNDPTHFNTSTGIGYLDVVGGDAAFWFNTNSISTGFLPGFQQFADFGFTGSPGVLQTAAADPFKVGGNDNLVGVLIPEPMTLSLFGAGLAGAAALRRRKANKKA